MSYNKTIWETGDVVSANKLNHIEEGIANAVEKQQGKDLSTEDYTTEEKDKLKSIEDGAQVNNIEGIEFNGTDLTPDTKTKKVNILAAPYNQAVPLPQLNDEGKILGYEAPTGSADPVVGWVEKPVDGEDAYGVYVKDTTDNPVMTRSQWLASLKGEKGDNAVNPFKGWVNATSDLPANPHVGDYAYIEDNGTTYVYRCATEGEWPTTSSEEKEPSDATFASAQLLNNVKIDDTHLSNPVGSDETNNPTLVKAEDVMQLKAKLEGVTASESKATPTSTGTVGNYIKPNNTEGNGSGWQWGIFNVVGYKSVRFLALDYISSTTPASGWLFLDDSDNIKGGDKYTHTAVATTTKELVIPVPKGATKFKTNIAWNVLTDNFYCYLQSGTSVGEELADKASYSEMKGLWMWKKNLINQDDLKIGGIYDSEGNWDNIDSEAHGIVSNKLYLEDGVTYTVSNVNGYKATPVAIGGSCILCITKFDANGNFLETYRPTGEITATDGGPNTNAAKSTFTYSKHRNAETGEIDEAYCVIRLRYNASSLTIYPNTYDSYKSAQVEVGNEVTELAPYLSEKIFDIATKEYVDGKVAEEVESLQEQIDDINDNILAQEEVLTLVERDYEFKDGNGVWLHKYLTTANTLIEDPDNVLALTPKSSTWAVIRYQVDGDKTYRGRTYTTGSYGGNVIYYWATEDKRLISRTTDTKTKANSWVEADITSPQNAKYLYVLVLSNNIKSATLYEISHIEKTIKEVVEEKEENLYKSIEISAKKKVSLKVLVIGDSFVIDSFAYVPIMLQKMYKDIDFVVGIAMESYQTSPQVPTLDDQGYLPSSGGNAFYHGTIAAHLRFLTIQEDYDGYNYYKYSSKDNAWSYSEVKLKDTLTDEDWDCIVIRANHQSGITSDGNIKFIDNDDPQNPTNVKGYGANYDYNNLVDRLRDAITKHVVSPVKFGALVPQTSPKDSLSSSITDSLVVVNSIDTRIQDVFSAAQLYTQYSFFDFVLPVGTAIQNARHIAQIRAFGDGVSYSTNNTNAGYMNSSDAHHLQDGIGREICAYTICLKLLELACNQKSIFGDKNSILKEDVNNYLVPAQKGSTVAGFIVKDDNYSDTKNEDIENYNQCLLRIMQKCCQLAVKNPYTIETGMDTICAVDIEELNSLKSAIDGED